MRDAVRDAMIAAVCNLTGGDEDALRRDLRALEGICDRCDAALEADDSGHYCPECNWTPPPPRPVGGETPPRRPPGHFHPPCCCPDCMKVNAWWRDRGVVM